MEQTHFTDLCTTCKDSFGLTALGLDVFVLLTHRRINTRVAYAFLDFCKDASRVLSAGSRPHGSKEGVERVWATKSWGGVVHDGVAHIFQVRDIVFYR